MTSETRLNYLPQYHIDREEMCKLVERTIGIERLLDAFCLGEYTTTSSFSIFRYEDEFYVLHRDSGMLVNWYKHLGRTNTCSQPNRTAEDYVEFFSLLSKELKEEREI